MPELPEVALAARNLGRLASRGKLQAFRLVGSPAKVRKIIPLAVRQILKSFVGQRVKVTSSGKHLVLAAGKDAVSMHFGMTGLFLATALNVKQRQHRVFSLKWEHGDSHFIDFRRFSRMRLGRRDNRSALGGYEGRFFLKTMAELHATLPALPGFLTQPRIAWLLNHGSDTGVGNYIATEALGRLRLSPFSSCRSGGEAVRLLRECQRVARRSFRAGGTSFGIGYFQLDGKPGAFAKQLRFYKSKRVPRTIFRRRAVYSQFSVQPANVN